MIRPVLARQARQFHLGNAGQQLVQVYAAGVIFHHDAASKQAGTGMNPKEFPQAVQDFASDPRVPVQPTHRDASLSQRPCPALVRGGGKRFILRQLRRILLGRAQGRQQRILVRRAGVETDKDITRNGVGINAPHSRDFAHLLFQVELPFARPMREMDTDSARNRG
jgi:hypothetical protein